MIEIDEETHNALIKAHAASSSLVCKGKSGSNELLRNLNQTIQNQKEKIEKMLKKELHVIEAVSSAFGKTPIACNGMFFVPVDGYNKIVEALNA